MYKIYLKQAWQILKDDKVFSIISILGTVLAIMMTMVIILTQEIKTKNITPEVNRERAMYIHYAKESDENVTNISPVPLKYYKQYLSQLKTPESVTLITGGQEDIYCEGNKTTLKTDIKYTDFSFWNIYNFTFLKGRSFTKEEFQSGIPVAIICKSVAQKLFKGEEAVGKEFVLDKISYKIIGLTEDVSSLCDHAYSQVWIPYTSNPRNNDMNRNAFQIILLAKSSNDFKKIKEEVRQNEIRNKSSLDKMKVQFWGPFSQDELLVRGGNVDSNDYNDPDMTKYHLKFFLTILVLLLIPAINLSGFSLFKIISRTSEIGIRKAFGANRKTILMQVLYENMLTSLIGGIIGLVFSVIAVNLIKDRLFEANRWEQVIGEKTIPISTFLTPAVFFYVFLACLVLNLLSAGIPAWKASRLNIVNAIRA